MESGIHDISRHAKASLIYLRQEAWKPTAKRYPIRLGEIAEFVILSSHNGGVMVQTNNNDNNLGHEIKSLISIERDTHGRMTYLCIGKDDDHLNRRYLRAHS